MSSGNVGKTVAIVQSNYIPWKGYFDLIRQADDFVIYDRVQYTKNDWRNRNRVKTANGVTWLTIPVRQATLDQRIMDTHAVDGSWRIKHWKTIHQSYVKSPFFKTYAEELESLYVGGDETNLSEINQIFIRAITKWLGIDTCIHKPDAFDFRSDDRTQRLIDICSTLGASVYLSGPSASDYLDRGRFDAVGIDVQWMDYAGYPVYPQLHGIFEHSVSVLDLLFSTGPRALDFLRRN